MIYVLVSTQLLTVVGILLALRWGFQYLERQEQHARLNEEAHRAYVEHLLRGHSRLVAELQEKHAKQVDELLKRAHHEREMLIERGQFPEQMRAAAQGAGQETGVSVEDEESEFDRENPDAPKSDEEDIPVVVTPVRPVMPAQPLGGNGHGHG